MSFSFKEAFVSPIALGAALGVTGALSGLVGLFIDINSQISIKWLLLVILLGSVSIIVLLHHAIYRSDLPSSTSFDERPFSLAEPTLLIIRRNDAFKNSIFVTGYLLSDQYERFAFVGRVEHIQELVVQVRVEALNDNFDLARDYTNTVVRPIVTEQALKFLAGVGK